MRKLLYIGFAQSSHTIKWVRYFRDMGDRVTLISFYPGEPIEGIDLKYIPCRRRYSPLLKIGEVRRLINQIKPDILHAHYVSSCGLVAALSGFHPLVISAWGDDILEFPRKTPLHRMAVVKALKSADRITATSQTLARRIDLLLKGACQITIIPFGVDIDKFKFVQRTPRGIITIGTVRNLTPKYGIDVLIRAFAGLCRSRNDLRLLIVGDGPSRKNLEELAANLGLSEKIEFAGRIPNDRVFEYMKKMDIFAMPSVGEGETFGVAAVEAMATGMPVVASNIGGLPEVVEDGVTGLLTIPGNSESLREALEFYIMNQARRYEDGIKARRTVEKKYDWRENALRMHELYRGLLGSAWPAY